MNNLLDSLTDSLESVQGRKLPPVEQWHPERVSRMDMVIRRDGSWWYQGSEIRRQRMVKLFSTVLRRDDDDDWCLVTPQEKLQITVEDAPFIATSLINTTLSEVADEHRVAGLTFETNVGDRVFVDQEHPLYVTQDEAGNPSPYVIVRRNLPALISRSVYYELVDLCEERLGQIGFDSGGIFHVLGHA